MPRSHAPIRRPSASRWSSSFIKAHQAVYPVRRMYRLLDVSPTDYYAWLRRTASQRAREDAMLTDRIRLIHQRAFGTYGAPRIHAALCASGIRTGRKRVARLMRMAAISGVSRRRAVRTTQAHFTRNKMN